MARGDVVVSIASVAAGSNLTYQPAAGVEVIIKSLIGKPLADIELEAYDGTNREMVIRGSDTGRTNMSHAVTNSVYIRILNKTTGTETVGFTGIQSK